MFLSHFDIFPKVSTQYLIKRPSTALGMDETATRKKKEEVGKSHANKWSYHSCLSLLFDLLRTIVLLHFLSPHISYLLICFLVSLLCFVVIGVILLVETYSYFFSPTV
jgi:hypothetical protein